MRRNKGTLLAASMQLYKCLNIVWPFLFIPTEKICRRLSLLSLSSGPGLKDLWSSAWNSPLSSQSPRCPPAESDDFQACCFTLSWTQSSGETQHWTALPLSPSILGLLLTPEGPWDPPSLHMPKMVSMSVVPPKDQVKLAQEAQSIQYVRSISLTVVSVCCLTRQNLMTRPVISIPLPTIKDLLVQEQKVSKQHLDCTPQMSNSL